VRQQAAGGGVGDVAVAAEELDGGAGESGGPFGGVEDGAGGVSAGGIAAVAGWGHQAVAGFGGVHEGVHVGDFALYQFEFADGLAELFAFADVGHDDVHSGLHEAEGAAGEDDAFVVEAAHEDFGAVAYAAEDVFFGDFAVF